MARICPMDQCSEEFAHGHGGDEVFLPRPPAMSDSVETRLEGLFDECTIGVMKGYLIAHGTGRFPTRVQWRGPGYDGGWQEATREETRALGEALLAAADDLPDVSFRDPSEPREKKR